jgi:hypothetical protein
MQTRPRRIVPLRPPAQDCAHALDAWRPRLQAAFASFCNALFDAACVANDAQRHAHTIDLLRAVKAQESAIVDRVCAEVARSGAQGTQGETPEAQLLVERALARHCAALPLEPDELALLQASLAEQLLAPQERPRTASAAAGERDSVARLAARLRAVGLELEPESGITADGTTPLPASAAATEQSPGATAQQPRRSVMWRAVAPALAAVALLALSALLLEPGSRQIRSSAPAAARIVPTQAPAATPAAPVAMDPTPQATTPQQQELETATGSDDPSPVTEPATERTEDVVPAPEVPTVAAPPGTVTAAAPDASPAAARLATQVDYLLRRGDAALAALRLSEPYADSAAANFAAVLAIDPRNVAARQGQERIVEAYVGLARVALLRGDTAYARQLLARARAVLPGSPALQQPGLEQITTAPAAGR